MDGTLHPLDETFGSHVNCRCVPTPVTKSWSDLLAPLGIDTSGLDDTALASDEQMTGAEWLDAQDEAAQKQVLGNKYSGWANGDFTLQDTVGTAYDEDWGTSRYERSLKDILSGSSSQGIQAMGSDEMYPSGLTAQDTFLRTRQADALATLTSTEKESIREYSSLNYRDINAFLRDPKSIDDSDKGWVQDEIAILDKTVVKGVIPADLTTYRGIEAYGGTLDFFQQNIGSVVRDDAFQSTSLNRETAFRFADEGGAVIHISVPKGYNGLYISSLSLHDGGVSTQAEHELLLPRGTSYKIVKYVPATNTDKAIFYFEVQP